MFTKKYDIDKDCLKVRFDYEAQCYRAYHRDGSVVTSLNLPSRLALKKKNELLHTEPSLLQKENDYFQQKAKKEKFAKLGIRFNDFQALTNLNIDTIDADMLEYLKRLTSDEDVLIGVHRTGECNLDQIANILTSGLIVNTRNGGTAQSDIELSNTISFYEDSSTIIKEIQYAYFYKYSLGSIVIRIPYEDLKNGNLFMIDSESGSFMVDPNYIVGFVPVEPNNKVKEIISRDLKPERPLSGIEHLYDDRDYAGLEEMSKDFTP